MQYREAIGIGGIKIELINYEDLLRHLRLLRLFNMGWKKERVKRVWQQAEVTSM